MTLRTVADVIAKLPTTRVPTLPSPAYNGEKHAGIALAVESMRNHMTDEGWQIMLGLKDAGGYWLCGYNCEVDSTSVPDIVQQTSPGVVVVQDKREWDNDDRNFREPEARFKGIEVLKNRPDIFKVTILKDAHQRPEYHRDAAAEMDCHAWIVYYHPRIVKRLAPYVREEHLIRTYHSIDPALVPAYSETCRSGCLLSGASNPRFYPLRSRLIASKQQLPGVELLPHPGYHRKGCQTPEYLRRLSGYKAAICTSSIFGYSLRKIIEATACGCVVITDLPTDEVLPEIDANLLRIPADAQPKQVAALVKEVYETYNVPHQREMAKRAVEFYDYREVGTRLVTDIEVMRKEYC